MILVTVGFACNNACSFCAQGELRATRPEAPPGEIARSIEAIRAGDTVAFVGGEPTIQSALPAWIRAAAARGASSIVVQTNGRRLAYRAFARELRQASRLLRLDVSLHGSTATMHDWHTGAPGSFVQTLQGLRNARAEGIPTGVTTVITRSNYRHLVDIVRVAHAGGATAMHFAAIEPLGGAARRRSLLVPAPQLVGPHLERASAEAERLCLLVAGDGAGADLFAGIGHVEHVEPPRASSERLEVVEVRDRE